MSLPKIIYVWKDPDEEDRFDGVGEENNIREGRTYGIYELKEIQQMIFERKPVKVK